MKGTHMISDHVHIAKMVSLSLTADDWELYDIEGREDVALILNEAVSVALTWSDKPLARVKIAKALEEYSKWGANDTEGHATVQQIWDLFYK
jgi:hypothetical protein